MRLIRYQHGGDTHVGVVEDDSVQQLDVPDAGDVPPVVAATQTTPPDYAGVEHDRSAVDVVAPIARPGKIVCVGLNYREHAIEGGNEIPDSPLLFAKATSAVVGPGDDVVHPSGVEHVDYEAELAVVVGRRGRHVDRADARDHVAGYTAFNDVSARDVQYAFSQYFRGKSFDTFAPMGPAVVTPDAVDPDRLAVRTLVDDEVRQDSSTEDMIFSVPELVESVTETMTLYPGDVIATGTPPGVGIHSDEKRVLEPGETVTVEIEGIGSLSNPVVAPGE